MSDVNDRSLPNSWKTPYEIAAQATGYAVSRSVSGQLVNTIATAIQQAENRGLEMRDLWRMLESQKEWSLRTFGEGRRTGGVTAHIAKELEEIRRAPDDLEEWIDVIILAMDGFWRAGGKSQDLAPMIMAKQEKNRARQWPKPTSEDEATEHIR